MKLYASIREVKHGSNFYMYLYIIKYNPYNLVAKIVKIKNFKNEIFRFFETSGGDLRVNRRS
jgi:hypothetical protein